MKYLILVICFFYTNYVISQPAENVDQGYEFSTSNKICNFRGEHSKPIKSIVIEAMNGNSLAAYYLYNSGNRLKSKNMPREDESFKIFLESGNPIGAMINGFMQLDSNNIEEGIKWIEIAANFGLIEAMYQMRTLHNGEEFPELKNRDIELIWWKKIALSGNIYNLKQYIHNNPHNLTKSELKHWQDAYKIVTQSDDFKLIYKNKSLTTSWILFQFNENRQRIAKVLKEHHAWYGNYADCR
jgi:hypothetical protein